MKTFLTLLILILSSVNIQKSFSDTNDFIEIKHTGMEEKHIRSLIISIKKINIEPDENSLLAGFTNVRSLTAEQKDAILNLQYDFVITNITTYQLLIDFVNRNQFFFTDSINKNHGDNMDYSITVKGKVYNIFYKSKNLFFSNLINYLRVKKGDKALIEKLSKY